MNTASIAWYHGGDLKNGKPKGTYLYVIDHRGVAEAHAKLDLNGKVYRLRPDYHHLVVDHHDGSGRKVVRQSDLRQCGGVLVVFEEVDG